MPRFQVGDAVLVRRYDDLVAQYGCNAYGNIDMPGYFNAEMKVYCGTVQVIVERTGNCYHFIDNIWAWSDQMLEPTVQNLAEGICGCGERAIDRLGGTLYCQECLDELDMCCRCGCKTANAVHCDDEFYCEICARLFLQRCNDCNEYHCNMNYIAGGSYVCDSCAESYVPCSSCGYLVHEEDIREYNEEWYCPSCLPREESHGYVHNHNYKPKANYLHVEPYKSPMLYMGVELEMETDDSVEPSEALELSKDESLYYLKSDSSLNDGFELVTHPVTFKYHMEQFPWKPLLKTLIDKGATSHETDTCGLHVHLSRKWFTVSEIVRFVAFINIQQDFCKSMARRNPDEWARFKRGCLRFKEQYNEDRYEAVNLQNSNTIEVRIFRGTLILETLKATLQFLHALSYWVKQTSIAPIVQNPEQSLKDFMQYVHGQPDSYYELISYIHARKIVPKEREEIKPEPTQCMCDYCQAERRAGRRGYMANE